MKWILLLLHGGGGRIFWRGCTDLIGLGCLPERLKCARDVPRRRAVSRKKKKTADQKLVAENEEEQFLRIIVRGQEGEPLCWKWRERVNLPLP